MITVKTGTGTCTEGSTIILTSTGERRERREFDIYTFTSVFEISPCPSVMPKEPFFYFLKKGE